jgi:lysophospholipase
MRLVSTPSNPVPDGAVTGSVKTRDGALLRYGRWGCEGRYKGAVCLLQGRAEYIEKYFETVRELRSRGFAVVHSIGAGRVHPGGRSLTRARDT